MRKEEPINVTCPYCKSDNVSKSRKPAPIVGYILLLIGLPVPSFTKEYHCFECLSDFKIKR